MALTIKKEAQEYELAPQGTHIARCYMVIDMGMQQTTFGVKHKIQIGWELPLELMKDNRPFVTSKEYTASLHPDSNLTTDLVSWRGRAFTEEELEGFDVFKVFGAPCMVTIIHTISTKGKTYANVKSVTSLPKGTVCPDPINGKMVFSLQEPVEEDFLKIPEWLQKKINRNMGSEPSPTDGAPQPPDFNDDIPFAFLIGVPLLTAAIMPWLFSHEIASFFL
jgi:hypothetical protein